MIAKVATATGLRYPMKGTDLEAIKGYSLQYALLTF